MNRRTAIKRTLLFGGAGLALWSGFSAYDYYRTPGVDELPSYHELIAEMAETIIPRTGTPGAKDANVADFIVLMIRDCTPAKVQHKFMAGLAKVEAYTLSKYGSSFAKCTPQQRGETVTHFEQRDKPYSGLAGKVSRRFFGDSFFVTMKRYTVMGYCTSMQGATQALAYDYIPGRYQGCMPLLPGQKGWAT